MAKTVIALFDDIRHAHAAVDDLRRSNNFTNRDITLMAHDADNRYSRYLQEHDVRVEKKTGTEADKGAAAGAGIGAVVGGIAGFLVGTGVIFLPGLGPVLAAGPLASTLLGIAGGAVAGGLVGGLVGLGIPEKEAHRYAEGLRRGGTLVVLRTEDKHVDDASRILAKHHPVDIEKRADVWREQGWSGRFEPSEEVYTTERIQEERAAYPMTPAKRVAVYEHTEIAGGIDDTGRTETTKDIYSRHEDEFRQHYATHASDGNRFDDVSVAYRVGAALGRKKQLANEDWNRVRTEAHKKWTDSAAGGGRPFDKVEEYIKYGWHKTKEDLWDRSSRR